LAAENALWSRDRGNAFPLTALERAEVGRGASGPRPTKIPMLAAFDEA
jgi:hypothetical protein